jgi:superfamily II DNA or RNA helicase
MTDSTHLLKFTDDQIDHQSNLIHLAHRYGYIEQGNIRDMAIQRLQKLVNHPLETALTKFDHVRKVFIKHLRATLDPMVYGVPRKWRKTQRELILATIRSFERGYIRPLSEVPTGSGKSMYIGALVRAGLETKNELGLDQEIHIITSRIAIAGQLIHEKMDDQNEQGDRPLDLGRQGDVRMWLYGLGESKIRLLAGKLGQDPKELAKDAVLTVSTYQGLRAGKIAEHFKKIPFMVICDESHRVTERVSMLLAEMKTMVVGVSATVLGPDRDPFMFFERIEREEVEKKRKIYIDYLCYHKSLAEMIKDQELKAVRWINAKGMKIDVTNDVHVRNKKGGKDIFDDLVLTRILARNPDLGAQVIAEAYIGNHEGLILSGSKPVYERRGIVFVDRVATAEMCAEKCNEMLIPLLKEKFGEKVHFKAAHVDGTMKEKEYNAAIKDFKEGKTTLMFSAEKIGEGVDLPFVNMIIPFRVLGFGSMWKLVQMIGRGERIDPMQPLDDLVVLDYLFESDRHLLSSVFGIFGRSSLLSGGLLAGWGTSYELEKKVFELLQKCKTWTEIWGMLTEEERKLFPYIEEKVQEEKRQKLSGHGIYASGVSDKNYTLESISFVEQNDLRLAMSLGNADEMLRYTMETLKEEGFYSLNMLKSLTQHSLPAIAKRRFGHFRDGLTMINLNLQETKPILTVRNMYQFIDLLRHAGFPEEADFVYDNFRYGKTETNTVIEKKSFETETYMRTSPKKRVNENHRQKRTVRPVRTENVVEQKKPADVENALESLIAFTQNRFGVEPEIESNFRDLANNESCYLAQAAIILPEGLKFSGIICKNKNSIIAQRNAAADLHSILADQIKQGKIQLYPGTEFYRNHLKVLDLIIYEYDLKDVYYRFTEREGIYVTEAITEKFKMKFIGNPAINKDGEKSKELARVMLVRKLMKELDSIEQIANVHSGRKQTDTLEGMCNRMQVGQPKRMNSTKLIKKTQFHEVTFSIIGLSATGLGISPEHARERAAEKLIAKLKDQGGEQRMN